MLTFIKVIHKTNSIFLVAENAQRFFITKTNNKIF